MPKDNLSTQFMDVYNEVLKLKKLIAEKQEVLNELAQQMHLEVPVANVDILINNELSYVIKSNDEGDYFAQPVYEYCKGKL